MGDYHPLLCAGLMPSDSDGVPAHVKAAECSEPGTSSSSSSRGKLTLFLVDDVVVADQLLVALRLAHLVRLIGDAT